MEMFKYALFAREFEREEIAIRDLKPKDDWNLPLLRIEVPPTDRTVPHLPFESAPATVATLQQTAAQLGRQLGNVLRYLDQPSGMPGLKVKLSQQDREHERE
jgi:hypothetical protein